MGGLHSEPCRRGPRLHAHAPEHSPDAALGRCLQRGADVHMPLHALPPRRAPAPAHAPTRAHSQTPARGAGHEVRLHTVGMHSYSVGR